MRAFRLLASAALTQFRLSTRDIEILVPILTFPLQTLAAVAILVEAHRGDLAGYALTASVLFTIGQMGLSISSEIVAQDRRLQLLELLVASPSPYVLLLAGRALVVTAFGCLGFAEGWLIIRFVFGIDVVIFHPVLLAASLGMTVLAATGTAIVTAALFSLARSTRTFQNAVNGPFYLLGGILVPVAYLPAWAQAASPLIYFFWAADLVRDSLRAGPVAGAGLKLAALAALALFAALAGAFVLRRMLDKLRRDGRLGLI